MSTHNQGEGAGRLVRMGAKFCTGGLAGAAGTVVSWIATGVPSSPVAATLGGGITGTVRTAVTSILDDFASRVLSSRQTARVSIASYRILNTIHERLIHGEHPREDGFFDPPAGSNDRSPAEQLFEGALIKCKNEHEEKKNRYVENIFANTVFRADVSADAANSLLNIAGRLSYRQFCILALLSRHDDFKIDPNNLSFRIQSTEYLGDHAIFLKHELADLAWFGFFDERRGSGNAYLSFLGNVAYDLMGLRGIEEQDLMQVRSTMP